jgi:hypothetical protein
MDGPRDGPRDERRDELRGDWLRQIHRSCAMHVNEFDAGRSCRTGGGAASHLRRR